MMKKLFPVELLWSSCLEMPSDLQVTVGSTQPAPHSCWLRSLLRSWSELLDLGYLLLNTIHHQPRRLLGSFYPQIKVQEKLRL